ncbi:MULTISPECIES: TetR/AcrR family transcriptional regulator [unclassified Curtobacterium]|uniref:TetR/AcrR family transcriptional regulator n=1 Tax=unclassified Curtobacterium TaxID=257496 RepID=UPI000DA916E8|nr:MULTISPECIES: TetR/AcrR family transcriptional regulator [unclassified Curtobacterium]PZE67270.1 TetR family transcriptional regulator [Curtobacterium sp. MCPF17_018]WIB70219.1 TetR/AcrR family transcriptional regulator [Curtobacterium sp. MCBD17_026]
MSTSSSRPHADLRRDAQQNRARIVEIARDAFAADGSATMQSIARAAGVGQGTLYRRFPTREALLVEVYRDDFEALTTAARKLLEHHSPLEALRRWFEALAAFGHMKHALSDVLDAVTRAELHDEQYDRILSAVAALLDAGKANGEVRADVAPDEVFPLLSFLWHVAPQTEARTGHLLDLVVDALREPRH